MDIFDRRAVKAAAGESLRNAASDPKKLILVHTGAALLLSLILTVIDYLLEQQIGSTSGLGGIGLRSVLSTAQSLLRFAQLLVLPAWNYGYTFACMRISRNEPADTGSLLEGFRRFFPILRLNLLQAAIYIAVAFACIYISSAIFMMLPWSAPLMEAMEPALSGGELSEEAMLAAMDAVQLPLMLISLAVFLPVCIPFFYQYRMAPYVLLAKPGTGAFAALRTSRHMTKGSRIALLKLDLSFWWFYALEVLTAILCYGDLILTAFGVTLPWSAGVSYFLFFGLYLVSQLLLYLWRKNEVSVTYAHVFAEMRPAFVPQAPQPPAQKQPWQY